MSGFSGFPSVVPGPETSILHENVLEKQIISPTPEPLNQKSWSKPNNFCFAKPSADSDTYKGYI